MLILGLLGMYFDAAVVFFTISSLLFRMTMAMLWSSWLEGEERELQSEGSRDQIPEEAEIFRIT